MKYWFDTEFIEDGRTIDLISLGIVAEDGREYYAISNEFNPNNASEWVKQNVLIHLPHRWFPEWQSRMNIRRGVAEFLGAVFPNDGIASGFVLPDGSEKPEVWAYYADYDWVVFCQLFGTMMDLPKGFPMYCRDIKQECDRLGNPKLPQQQEREHNALADARWNKKAWEFLQAINEKTLFAEENR
jgi:3' exoribonuclease, RNase T-like